MYGRNHTEISKAKMSVNSQKPLEFYMNGCLRQSFKRVCANRGLDFDSFEETFLRYDIKNVMGNVCQYINTAMQKLEFKYGL